MADSSSNTAVVAIVILVIAALVFFYFMFVRSGGGDEPDIEVDLPDKQGAMMPDVETPPAYIAEMHLA